MSVFKFPLLLALMLSLNACVCHSPQSHYFPPPLLFIFLYSLYSLLLADMTLW